MTFWTKLYCQRVKSTGIWAEPAHTYGPMRLSEESQGGREGVRTKPSMLALTPQSWTGTEDDGASSQVAATLPVLYEDILVLIVETFGNVQMSRNFPSIATGAIRELKSLRLSVHKKALNLPDH